MKTPIEAIDPTGKSPPPDAFVRPARQAISEKIFWLSEYSEYPIFASVPPHRKGRIMIVANAGRDAVDARSATDESAHLRTEKTCGPDTPTLVSSLRQGAQATVTKKPGTPGRARHNP